MSTPETFTKIRLHLRDRWGREIQPGTMVSACALATDRRQQDALHNARDLRDPGKPLELRPRGVLWRSIPADGHVELELAPPEVSSVAFEWCLRIRRPDGWTGDLCTLPVPLSAEPVDFEHLI